MEGFAKEVCKRLPLAESVLRLFDIVTQEDFLGDIFERHRGRSYEDVITFPVMVSLTADALLQYQGSGHRSFRKGQENEVLQATIEAMYGKLRRIPISLSVGLFSETTRRLEDVFPATENRLPKSLRRFELTAIDGKKIKHVAKRMKALRKVKGHVFGGKTVVALSLRTNMAVALAANPDGEVSDAPLVPDVLAQVRGTTDRPRVWIADRQFCDLNQPQLFTAEGDHFLIRYNAKVKFHRDRQKPVCQGKDEQGRSYKAAAQVAHRLDILLRSTWSECWWKAPAKVSPPQQYEKEYLKGGHDSVYRILNKARSAQPARE